MQVWPPGVAQVGGAVVVVELVLELVVVVVELVLVDDVVVPPAPPVTEVVDVVVEPPAPPAPPPPLPWILPRSTAAMSSHPVDPTRSAPAARVRAVRMLMGCRMAITSRQNVMSAAAPPPWGLK
jgi:hypothetical protein